MMRIMGAISAVFLAAGLTTGCKMKVSSEGACCRLFTLDQASQKVYDVTTIKVRQKIFADYSCSTTCTRNHEVNWGDGYWGPYFEHFYDRPGTFTVTYSCELPHPNRAYARKKRARRMLFKNYKREVTTTILVTE